MFYNSYHPSKFKESLWMIHYGDLNFLFGPESMKPLFQLVWDLGSEFRYYMSF